MNDSQKGKISAVIERTGGYVTKTGAGALIIGGRACYDETNVNEAIMGDALEFLASVKRREEHRQHPRALGRARTRAVGVLARTGGGR
jgi:hypothetical protein